MPESKADRSLEEEVMLFQLLQKHAEQLQAQAQAIQQRLFELFATEQAVTELLPKSEALIPLGAGVFTSGTTQSPLLVNVGANVFIEKPPAAVRTHVEAQKKEVEAAALAVQQELQRTATTLQELAHKIQGEASKRGLA